MRAIVLTSPTAEPQAADFAEPDLSQGEIVELVGAGLHQVVRAVASGRHYTSDAAYPQVPGVDAVARTADGRLVYTGWVRAPWGTMAERMAAPVGVELPAEADPLAIAAGMNPGMSGWVPLRTRLDEVGTLGTVLVVGATGMAGRMATQSALALGAARVVAVGRDPERLEAVATLGATTVPVTGPDDAPRLAEALADDAPSVVLDYVWGATAEVVLTALQRRGRGDDSADITYTQIGSMGGATAAVPSSLLRSRRLRIVGSGAGSVSTARLLAEMPALMGLVADGTVTVPYTAYSFGRVAEAWAHTGDSRAVLVP